MMHERMTSEQIKPRVEKRMAIIDAQPPQIRALVHEYGWNVIKSFLDAGVSKPSAVELRGGKVTGAGIGVKGDLGMADIDVEIDGYTFNLEITPRPKQSRG